MPRISTLTEADAPILENVRKSMGMTPNLLATMAHSPAALQAYLGFGQALGKATLSAALREQIAVTVAGENSCGYCASAHTLLGRNAGVDAEEIERNLRGESAEPRTGVALDFARAIVSKRGWVADEDLSAVRAAGYSEAEIVEIVATVALNIFTNYFNHIADPVIDFPEVAVPEPVHV